jgi:peptidoglycan/LPS O-acetylase OafA/YrhL
MQGSGELGAAVMPVDEQANEGAGKPESRLGIVDALRGCAALAVAWYHFTQGGGLLAPGLLKSSGTWGWLGVEVFFVISGFIIPYSMSAARYALPRDAGRFLARRLLRLEPPYVASVALCLVLAYLSTRAPGFRGVPVEYSAGQLLAHVGYLAGLLGYDWINVVYWSLALEFQYYLLMALAFPLLAHDRAALRLAGFAALCLVPLAAPDPLWVTHWLGLFGIGIAAWRHSQSGGSAEFVLLLAASGASTWATLGPAEAVAGATAALLIAYARMPRIAAFAWLGAVSYSVYLLHVPLGGRVINLAGRLEPGLPRELLGLALALALTLVAAALWYRWIEKPSHALARKVAYGGLRSTAPGVVRDKGGAGEKGAR